MHKRAHCTELNCSRYWFVIFYIASLSHIDPRAAQYSPNCLLCPTSKIDDDQCTLIEQSNDLLKCLSDLTCVTTYATALSYFLVYSVEEAHMSNSRFTSYIIMQYDLLIIIR